MDFLYGLDPGADAGLGAVFVLSALAATLLPGGSELVFAGFVALHPDQGLAALALATLGNTLGGMSTYALGRLVRRAVPPPRTAWLAHHGAPALLLAWLPLVGDALCAAAGWLRLPAPTCALWMGIGKCARYAAIYVFAMN